MPPPLPARRDLLRTRLAPCPLLGSRRTPSNGWKWAPSCLLPCPPASLTALAPLADIRPSCSTSWMKGLAVTFWGVLQVAACSVGKPPASEVAVIEALTARSTCVGKLSNWHREFYFQPAVGVIGMGVDKSVINVGYTPAGHRNEPAGRFIKEPPTMPIIDDSQHAFAWGRWDRKAQRFKEWSCGCNFGAPSNAFGPPICPANGR